MDLEYKYWQHYYATTISALNYYAGTMGYKNM